MLVAVLVTSVATLVGSSAAGCGSASSVDADDDGGSSGSSGSSGFGQNDAGSDGAFDPDAACATTTVTAKRAVANFLFVVDRSGSMNCNPPPITSSTACETSPVTADATKPTKWSLTKDALKSAIAAMPPTDSAGISYFNVDDDCAVQAKPSVPVQPIDPAHLALLGQSLDNVTPAGLTPIVGGVTLGYQHLYTNAFGGRKYLVLLTDGQETCAADQKDEFLTKTVVDASLVGIRTFVIGAPGSEPSRAFLSQIAFTGQTPRTPTCNHGGTAPDVGDCHFDLTNAGLNLATELTKALDAINKEALSCEYDVPQSDGGEIDYTKVNVFMTAGDGSRQTIPQDPSTACPNADGWQYSPDKKQILLCGPACEKAKAQQGGSVSIALGCVTVVR